MKTLFLEQQTFLEDKIIQLTVLNESLKEDKKWLDTQHKALTAILTTIPVNISSIEQILNISQGLNFLNLNDLALKTLFEVNTNALNALELNLQYMKNVCG